MNYDIIIFVDENSNDDELTFMDEFIPDSHLKTFCSDGYDGSIIISLPKNYSGKLTDYSESRIRDNCDDIPFWKKIFSEITANSVIKVFADTPFLDSGIINDMAALHGKYLAEYTYSENLPEGLTCEIVSRELIDSIPETHENTIQLSKIIKSNINQFDIEIFYQEPDMRDKRISFRASSPRDKRIMQNITMLNNFIPKYNQIADIINSHPDVLYIGPSYIEIELTGKCDLDCIYCYRNLIKPSHGDMDIELLRTIITQINSFSFPYTVCFGGSGEPMMNTSFYEHVEYCLDQPLIKNIIVETNGIYSNSEYKNLLKKDHNQKINTIFNICGYNEDTYKLIHGMDFFNQVYQNIINLIEDDTRAASLYVQIMKINETERFLDKYYDFWEKHKIQIILQKQNTFLGRIQDRRYSDLSPLDRIPCWHLQRDLYILSDGKIAFCKQDFEGMFSYGNSSKESLNAILKKMKSSFLNDYKKEFPTKPECKSCDEWYTFNF